MENEREDRKQRQKLLEEEAKRQEKIRKKQKEKEVHVQKSCGSASTIKHTSCIKHCME